MTEQVVCIVQGMFYHYPAFIYQVLFFVDEV